MHPIVRGYVETNERFVSIVESYYDKNQVLEATLYELLLNLNVEDFDPQLFLKLDQAVISGHPDPSVYMIYIAYALSTSSRRNQLDRARAIQSIGSSLSKENIHPVVQALYIQGQASLKFYEGNTLEYNALLKKMLSFIDKKCPRYSTVLSNVATFISWDGKLKELDKDDLDLLNSPTNENIALACLQSKLANAVFTGNFQEAILLIEEQDKNYKLGSKILMESFKCFVRILAGNFNEKDYEDEFYKIYCKIGKNLIEENYEEASKYIQYFTEQDWGKKFSQQFAKYMPVHLELCLKNTGKAKLLMQEMQKKDSEHYLDDFFLARIQLLEQDMEGAYALFEKFIENINRFEAMNRFLFELQFAREMSLPDIVRLTKGIRGGISEKKAIKNKIESFPLAAALIEKGVQLLIGDTQILLQLKKLVKKFANLNGPILITGETGTGKELVSRAIHEEGPHMNEPFMAINCGALTDSLLESELFGYEAGAFTGAIKERKGIFEAAGKGTVFLDEFGDISPKMQVSLLRVLESGEIRLIGSTKTRQVECKIVIATNIDLQKAVEAKKFREDLYFRLKRFDIQLPPLRERKEDIPKLIDYFLNHSKDQKAKQTIVSKSLLDALINYRWPGNIRELKNEMERIKVLHANKEFLDLEDFDFTHLQGAVIPMQEKEVVVKKLPTSLPSKNEKASSDRILNILQKKTKIDQRLEFLTEVFREHKNLTRLQVMEIASISPGTATKDLEILCKSGVIKKITPSKSVKSHYFSVIDTSVSHRSTETQRK